MSGYSNFDKPSKYIASLNSSASGTSPFSLIGGNRCVVISMFIDDGTLAYNAQIAFGFGQNIIAFRKKQNSTTWSAWAAI